MEVRGSDRALRLALHAANFWICRYAQQIEKKLESELKNKDSLPRFQDIDTLIEE